MRAIEQRAIAAGAVTGFELMERACQGALAAILGALPAEAPRHAVVLAGPGNNGGDGLGLAVLLRAGGWRVELLAPRPAPQTPAPQTPAPQAPAWRGDAGRMAARWDAPVGPLSQAAQGPRPGLLVDALWGIGLARPLPAEAVEAHRAVQLRQGAGPLLVAALDCVSGLCCDTGRMRLPEAARGAPDRLPMQADLTVTFHAPKPGHLLGAGPRIGGRLERADLGLPQASLPDLAQIVAPAPEALRWIRPAPEGHKYGRGHALVLAGGAGQGGAGRLAARAALRAGAGLVTLACPPAALPENAAQLNAIMLRALAGPDDLAALLQDRRITALCLGPGLGVGAATRALAGVALAAGRPVVLDADALASFAAAPETLFAALHPRAVLTPHEGEFARLFPDLAAGLGADRLGGVRQAAARSGAVVLLKGPVTVIATPGGDLRVHAALGPRAAPWLATAGAGDVLAGMIAGLAARPDADLPLPERVASAVWLHVEAARQAGAGLIAEDLPEALAAVYRGLGL